MAYTPHKWSDGELITAERLNALENGAAGPKDDKGDIGATGPKGDPGAKGATGPAGKGVKSLSLTTNGEGKVTGGTLTFSDDTTAPVTVTTS